ncbi:hypothetical protein HA402_010538 [Bradysia odoriphaga]|nr:hypothetical protein HA402_010538 [Bradysia odoriphaga]
MIMILLTLLQEFNNKVDAAAAKAKGFEYLNNGRPEKGNFVNTGVVSCFMRQKLKSLGAGY